ncbi:hypothetical protein C240_822 [Enterococcus sp. 5H]|nr:hypothetical protein [Enterococcus sp. 5H]
MWSEDTFYSALLIYILDEELGLFEKMIFDKMCYTFLKEIKTFMKES